MFRSAVIALALLTFANPAQAHHHRHLKPVKECGLFSCAAQAFGNFTSSVVAEARSQLGNGAVYGRRSLWCARFVNYVLKKTGHTGTGSDMALSFAHYGHRVYGPQVGAIAVMGRRGGGHVGIVSGIDAQGNPILISGNYRGRVREAPYSRRRILAYVMPE